MSHYNVSASAYIEAGAERVYNILADYRRGHPGILPPQYFQNLVIEEGGFGAGTKIRFQMKVFGTIRDFRAEISEPHPGRLLVETDLTSGAVTTFTVSPSGREGSSIVKIMTRVAVRSRLLAPIERFITSRYLHRIYREELALLNAAATGRYNVDLSAYETRVVPDRQHGGGSGWQHPAHS